jgi:hypothetical protein
MCRETEGSRGLGSRIPSARDDVTTAYLIRLINSSQNLKLSIERDHSKVQRSVLRSAYTWFVKFILEI